MGLISALLDNAHKVNIEKAAKTHGHILGTGETIEAAFKLVRDMILFTNRRLILVDVQGMTGKKIEIKSIPYGYISQFSVITTGHFDLNAELKIQVVGQNQDITLQFNKDSNVYEAQAVLAEAIMSYGD